MRRKARTQLGHGGGCRGRFASDETIPITMNYLHTPIHLLGARTADAKLGTYSHWLPGTTQPNYATMEIEFYDYTTHGGRAETQSDPHSPRARALPGKLFREHAPTQMEAPLPPALQAQARIARESYLAFLALVNAYSIKNLIDDGELTKFLGFGGNF